MRESIDAIEAKVAELWARNLRTSPPPGDAHYFRSGGDSLLATQLLSWFREELGAELSLLDVFEAPTPAGMAQRLRKVLRDAPGASEPSGERLDCFHFGGTRRLFGALHRARGLVRGGVVLCYPFGQEYMRTHRAFVELARRIARSGRHVLRFDYYGSGDSEGDSREADLSGWCDDVESACRELRERTGVDAVDLVGARVGANLVARVAARVAANSAVLWEPISSGEEYLAQLEEGFRRLLRGNAELDGYAEARAKAAVMELVGFEVSPRLHQELGRLTLAPLVPNGSPRRVLRLFHGDGGGERPAAADAAQERWLPGTSNGMWLDEDRENKGRLPVEAIHGIVSWLEEDR